MVDFALTQKSLLTYSSQFATLEVDQIVAEESTQVDHSDTHMLTCRIKPPWTARHNVGVEEQIRGHGVVIVTP